MRGTFVQIKTILLYTFGKNKQDRMPVTVGSFEVSYLHSLMLLSYLSGAFN